MTASGGRKSFTRKPVCCCACCGGTGCGWGWGGVGEGGGICGGPGGFGHVFTPRKWKGRLMDHACAAAWQNAAPCGRHAAATLPLLRPPAKPAAYHDLSRQATPSAAVANPPGVPLDAYMIGWLQPPREHMKGGPKTDAEQTARQRGESRRAGDKNGAAAVCSMHESVQENTQRKGTQGDGIEGVGGRRCGPTRAGAGRALPSG